MTRRSYRCARRPPPGTMAARILERRQDLQLTLNEVAARAGRSYDTVHRMAAPSRGARKRWGRGVVAIVEALAAALEVEPAWLAGLPAWPPPLATCRDCAAQVYGLAAARCRECRVRHRAALARTRLRRAQAQTRAVAAEVRPELAPRGPRVPGETILARLLREAPAGAIDADAARRLLRG